MNRAWPSSPAVLVAVTAIAFAVRLAAAWALPNIIWPDEIFQTLEPAHRLTFGYGIVTWEFREAARSWALPGFLAALMKVGAPFGELGHLRAAQVGLVAASLVPIVATFRWARRHGTAAATAGAAVTVAWFELVYFSPKALSEVVAAHVLLAALAIGLHAERERSVAASGVLVGLAAALRMHLLPACVVALVFVCGKSPRRYAAAALGAAAPIAAAGLLDLATWSAPFASYWANFRYNVVEGHSARFGVLPWHAYLDLAWDHWGVAAIPLIGAAAAGAVRLPALAACAVAVLVTHSLFGHKEYRFGYPVVLLVVVLAGVGTAGVVRAAADRFRRPAVGIAAAAVVVWSGLSLWRAQAFASDGSFGFTAAGESMWKQGRGGLEAMRFLGADPSVCGVGLVNVHWGWTGGHTWMHRDVPIVMVDSIEELRRLTPAFNAMLVPRDDLTAFAGVRAERCWSDVCIIRRSGPCVRIPGAELNAQLAAKGG